MDNSEFDRFADTYRSTLQDSIGISGESTEFFTKYKVVDTAGHIRRNGYPENLSILDFGAGIGESVPYFLEEHPESNITCLDVSQNSLLFGKERHEKKVKFIYFDGRRIPLLDCTYHVVFAACVFHHIPASDHDIIFTEIKRILKPNGLFIVFEHNPYNFLSVRTVQKCPFDKNAILIKGSQLKKSLQHCDYRDVQLKYRIFFPNLLKLLRPLERYLEWLPLGAQYYVLAKK